MNDVFLPEESPRTAKSARGAADDNRAVLREKMDFPARCDYMRLPVDHPSPPVPPDAFLAQHDDRQKTETCCFLVARATDDTPQLTPTTGD